MAGVGPVTEPGALQGMAQNNVQIFSLARKAPWLINLLYRMQIPINDKKLMRAATAQMSKPDLAAMQEPMVLYDIVKDFNEAFRQNTKGVVQEGALLGSDWGFKLSDIQGTIYLWQGEEDTNVPANMGRYQAGNIPNCIAKFYPGEGHISLVTKSHPGDSDGIPASRASHIVEYIRAACCKLYSCWVFFVELSFLDAGTGVRTSHRQ